MLENKILYGGDYNPEQWLNAPEILEKDIELFLKAKINTVTLGVFSWSVLEPQEGNYQLEWLRKIIDRLFENGIKTILGTPSAARPKWLSDKYPEVLRVRDNGVRNHFGGRHNHCYTSPVYREKVAMINTKLAEEFKDHPAVLMWHISNEFGGECHCELCQAAFRKWLSNQYESIDELNNKWWTMFWSHSYQSFDQIESPSSIGEQGVHGLNLDWRRFVTAQTADFINHEIHTLKKVGVKQPTTTNLMYSVTDVNYDKLAETIDIISWDTYPLWHKKEDILIAYDTGFWHDYMRSLKNQPFLLMESCPTSTNWQGVSKLKAPGLLEAASLQAVAHGSDSVLYFQMRQSRGSSEKFHGAVINNEGRDDARVFKEVVKTGVDLEKLGEVYNTATKAQVALIYDVENRWAISDSQGPRNDGMPYMDMVMKAYRALRRKGFDIDVISMEKEIKDYTLVVVPMLYMLRSGIEEKLEQYVSNGGTVIVTCWTGIVDECDRSFIGGTPHHLQEVVGLYSREIDGLYDWEQNSFVASEQSPFKAEYYCKNLCEVVEVTTAKVLMTFGSDFYRGYPAVTENQYKKGRAYYICADVEEKFYDDLLDIWTKEVKIKIPFSGKIPPDVEVNIRQGEEGKYIFVQNFSRENVDISCMKMEGEIIMGDDKMRLSPYATLVFKQNN